MATRLVHGGDGRDWILRTRLEWRTPATADDFEHDISAGYLSAVLLCAVLFVLTVVLIIWTPDDVVVPLWLVLVLLLVVLFFPLRWAVRRPWSVIAETGGDGDPAERWTGTVRGLFTVRQEVARVAQTIEKDSEPGFEGPLHPVA